MARDHSKCGGPRSCGHCRAELIRSKLWRAAAAIVPGQEDFPEIHPRAGGGVWMRSSRFHAVMLEYTREEWTAFLNGVRAGEFDDLR